MERVKELIAKGRTIPEAIKGALAMPLTAFCAKYALNYGTVSTQINAVVRPTEPLLLALAAELGGTAEDYHELLWEAMRPAHLAAS